MNVGDRVKVTKPEHLAGLTGVIVRKTSGHWNCHVWLDKGYIYRRHGSRDQWYCISVSEKELALTDEVPMFYTRPTWKVVLKTINRDMHLQPVEVVEAATGEVVGTVRGARGASQRVERLTARARMDARRAAS